MGFQFVFVVETSNDCKSDWIYIKNTITKFYSYDLAEIKFTPVYMDGKTKYMKKEKVVSQLVKQYKMAAKTNHSQVFYCFDCDDYDTRSEDMSFLEQVSSYCENKNYELVWFCKDIERVYMGQKVPDTQKKRTAESFAKNNLISKIDERSLSGTVYKRNTSNILSILDKYRMYIKRK